MTLPAALAYLTVAGASPLEEIEAAAHAGFSGVGLRFAAPAGVSLPVPVVGDKHALRAIRARCAATGVPVLDVEMIVLSPAFAPAAQQPLLEAAGEVGARFVQVVCEEPDPLRAADILGDLAERAAPLGLTLALEFMRFRALRTLAEAAAMVERSGAHNVGVLIDSLHLARSGGHPDEVQGLDPQRIAFAQLCDAPATPPRDDELLAEARNDRLYPGEGALPLRELLKRLPPHVPISLEVPRWANARASVEARARACAEAMRRFLSGPSLRVASI